MNVQDSRAWSVIYEQILPDMEGGQCSASSGKIKERKKRNFVLKFVLYTLASSLEL